MFRHCKDCHRLQLAASVIICMTTYTKANPLKKYQKQECPLGYCIRFQEQPMPLLASDWACKLVPTSLWDHSINFLIAAEANIRSNLWGGRRLAQIQGSISWRVGEILKTWQSLSTAAQSQLSVLILSWYNILNFIRCSRLVLRNTLHAQTCAEGYMHM